MSEVTEREMRSAFEVGKRIGSGQKARIDEVLFYNFIIMIECSKELEGISGQNYIEFGAA